MKRILSFFWKNKILIIFLSFVLVLIFLSEIKKPQEKTITPSPTPLPLQGVLYKDLTPGLDTKKEIDKKLGKPINEASLEEKEILDYKSTSPTTNHQVIYEGQIAVFIREIVSSYDDKTMNDLEKDYGKAPYTLYRGSEAISGFFLYAYPEKGLAFIANPNGGVLLEIWYFIPTTLEEFKSEWAPEYSENPPPPIQ